jgi:hypothetical protein
MRPHSARVVLLPASPSAPCCLGAPCRRRLRGRTMLVQWRSGIRRQGAWTPRVTGGREAPMRTSGGRGQRTGRKAGTGLGGARRASLGRSRDSRPRRQRQRTSAVVNTGNSSSPSSKTARFIGSGDGNSCGIGWTSGGDRTSGGDWTRDDRTSGSWSRDSLVLRRSCFGCS